MTDTAADYPRWDERHATTLVSTPDVLVEMDWVADDPATLVLRRTVWSRSSRRDGRHILWTGDVAAIPREAAPAMARDLVSALV